MGAGRWWWGQVGGVGVGTLRGEGVGRYVWGDR